MGLGKCPVGVSGLASLGHLQVHGLADGQVAVIALLSLLDQGLHVLSGTVRTRSAMHLVGVGHSLGTLLAPVVAGGHHADGEADLSVLLVVLVLANRLRLAVAVLVLVALLRAGGTGR